MTYVNATGTAGTNAVPSCMKALVRHDADRPGASLQAGSRPAWSSTAGRSTSTPPSRSRCASPSTASPARPAGEHRAHRRRRRVPGLRLTARLRDAGHRTSKAGVHTICVTGVNAASSAGADAPLGGCAKVTISHSPLGSVPSVAVRSTGVGFAGWAIDQDTTKPVTRAADGRRPRRCAADGQPGAHRPLGALPRLRHRARLVEGAAARRRACTRPASAPTTCRAPPVASTNLGCTTFRS